MSSGSIRLLVVAEDPAKKALLEDRLTGLKGIENLGVAHNRRTAFAMAKDLQPDVMLIDLMLPGFRSITLIERVTEALPQVKTLAMSPADPPHDRVILAAQAGALGYVCRDDSLSDIEAAIQHAHQGLLWLPPEPTYEVLKDTAPELGVSSEERRNRLMTVVLGLVPLMGLIAALTGLLWRKYWGQVGVRVVDLGVDPTTRATDVLVGLLTLLGIFGPLLFVDRWLLLIGEWIETKPGLSGIIDRGCALHLGKPPIGRLVLNRTIAWIMTATAVVLFGLLLARYADLILILFVGPAVGVALLASFLGLDDELPRALQRGSMSRMLMTMLVVLVVLFLIVLGGEIWVKGPDLRTDGMHGLLAPQMLGLSARPMVLYDLDGNLEPLGALYLGGNADLYVLYDPCAETVRLVPVGSSRVEMVDEVSCGGNKPMKLAGLKVPRKTLFGDLVAGLIMALVSIPGALANGLLAGVNPIFGLYSMIAGTTVAALFTSSVIMNVDSTSATALATLDALSGVPQDQHLASLVVLGLLVGLFMLIMGFLKLGFLVRFISNAVMTGFLSGLGVLTILGQVGDLTGYSSDVTNKVVRTADTALNWRQVDQTTLAVGLMTILLILAVNRTRLEKYSFLVAVVVSTAVVALLDLTTVAVVGDATQVLRSLPGLQLPDLSLVLSLLLPALAIAIIALVQAAGVSSSVPNPDGDYPDPSGDFRGQGAGNIAAGLVGGIPVGGSMSGTFLIQSAGGKSRWANISTGLFAAIAVLAVGPLIEAIPMPTLAGLLIVVGVSLIKVPRIQTVWHTGPAPAAVMAITFFATLFAPIQVAVALGVALHMLLHVFRSSEAVRLERILHRDDGAFVESEVPEELPSGEIVILQPIGNLFFAGVAELEEKLPDVAGARGTAVIFRLRDRDEVGSTFIRALDRYTRALLDRGNLLLLEGLNQRVVDQLKETGLLDLIGEENVFPGQPEFGAALKQALAVAEAWLQSQVDEQ